MFGHNKSDDGQATTGPGDVQTPTMIDDNASKDLVGDVGTTATATAQPDPQPSADPTPAASTPIPTPLSTQVDDQQTATPQADTSLDSEDETAATDTSMPAEDDSQPATTPTPTPVTTDEASDTSSSTPAVDVDEEAPHTSGPVDPPPAPAADSQVEPEDDAEETSVPTPAANTGVPSIDKDKLASMKQQALDHLEPLADHLEQDPEEEFRTTMMRIQANDNHTLLDKALEAAKKIKDDKVRAQAMLDIINEINYFSQTQP